MSECMIVEYEPNKIILNVFSHISKRCMFITSNLGTTLIPTQADKTIIEQMVCQGSFYKCQVGYKSIELFCNLHSTERRADITKDYID